jgi:hypothetical protein
VSARRPSITRLFDEGTAIDEALRLGVQDALQRHKRLGQRVAVWRDGRAVVLEPDQIPVEPQPAPSSRRRPRRTRRT